MNSPGSSLVHEALIYSSDDEFLERVVPFVRDGLANGDPLVVVLMPKRVALLREALGAEADGIRFVDSSTHYHSAPHALADYRRQIEGALERPDIEVVRLIGDVELGPTSEEHASWKRYESVVNQAFADYPAWFLCPYDARALPEQVLADALQTHPFVSAEDQLATNLLYVETDDLVPRPLVGKRRPGSGEPLARMTVSKESELDDLRRVVAGAARAAGLAPPVVDDVTVAAVEFARDALGYGETNVEITRDGAKWNCEITTSGLVSTPLGEGVGLSIARLISEETELFSGPGEETVRLTFAGAKDARQRILDASSELFYQNGIRATGINAIISHSGVAKATFFSHFPAKSDLVLAWLEQPATRRLERIRNEVEATGARPATKLLTFFDLLGEWFAQVDFRGCPFQNAVAETPEAADPIRQAADEYALQTQRYLEQTARDAGLSHPARVAEQLNVLIQGAIATAMLTGSPSAAKVARAAAKRILTAS
jgi:AcrR family transcriptional regulator